MRKYHFSMILSESNLFKSIPMYISLCRCCSDFKLFILCMDDSVYHMLNKIGFKNVILIQLKDIERNNFDLALAKANRIFHEYCWTLKPIFLYYVMNKYDNAEYYAHLDADLFFFFNIDYIFNENPNASIFLTHHRNSKEFNNYYELSGLYNTGFVGFKNNNEAKSAVRLWGDSCLKKCTIEYDTINKTFGDQRYVEEWPNIFKNVHIVNSIGVNAAFWNIKNYKVSKLNNVVYVDDSPLIFYHFSSVIILGSREFDLCSFYHIDDENLMNYIYDPYVRWLSKSIENVITEFPWFNAGFVDRANIINLHNYKI
ncbi:hypothetical protein [Clostridium sp. DJ247]|uniref:hypothetical protein n=1 Tax=Clostridium sp. DJ247 TaxID=2726188 RepID=UPI001624F710|nr:hypothetical protein [Clostridium sp. DJ247]MBC2580167.1 hypothetical protein [Clostridium sp. DJ247]